MKKRKFYLAKVYCSNSAIIEIGMTSDNFGRFKSIFTKMFPHLDIRYVEIYSMIGEYICE